jgi:hypothetical protein
MAGGPSLTPFDDERFLFLMSERPLCGDCPACLERTAALLAADEPEHRLCEGAPSAERLLRHAERFGPELVKETAAELGVSLRVKAGPRPKRRRRTSAELLAQVAELRSRGLLPAAIADALNVSDRRVRDVLAGLDGGAPQSEAA